MRDNDLRNSNNSYREENQGSDNGIQRCNQCGRHCPVTALSCDRGRAYWEKNQGDNENEATGDDNSRGSNHGEGHGWHGGENHERGNHDKGRHAGCPVGMHGNHDSVKGGRCGRNHDDHGKGHGRDAYDKDDLGDLMIICTHHIYHSKGNDKGYGLSQNRILMILAEEKQMTQKALQEILHIQPGSISETLSKLEEKGLIVRNKDEEDKRKSLIVLTDQGIQSAQELHKNDGEDEVTDLFSALDDDEKTALKDTLKKLLESWK
jgi:DNA-binding MarR family transcriptional regulator